MRGRIIHAIVSRRQAKHKVAFHTPDVRFAWVSMMWASQVVEKHWGTVNVFSMYPLPVCIFAMLRRTILQFSLNWCWHLGTGRSTTTTAPCCLLRLSLRVSFLSPPGLLPAHPCLLRVSFLFPRCLLPASFQFTPCLLPVSLSPPCRLPIWSISPSCLMPVSGYYPSRRLLSSPHPSCLTPQAMRAFGRH